jgi:hypothetical protein
MIHGQIISGLYTTLINLSPMTYKERTKQRERERCSSYSGSGSEGFHLILHQVDVVLGPQQLQLELQLRGSAMG